MSMNDRICQVKGCRRFTTWIAYVGWQYDNPHYGGLRSGPMGLCDAHKKLLEGPILTPVELVSQVAGAKRWVIRTHNGGPYPLEAK